VEFEVRKSVGKKGPVLCPLSREVQTVMGKKSLGKEGQEDPVFGTRKRDLNRKEKRGQWGSCMGHSGKFDHQRKEIIKITDEGVDGN